MMAEEREDCCSSSSVSSSSSSAAGTSTKISSRESIRMQLAQGSLGPDEDERQKDKSLLICFLNEAVYEEDELKENDDDDGENSEGEINLNKPSARFIAKNNISRKKNHVIIPLTPTSATAPPVIVPEVETDDLQSPFALYLKEIRLDARQKLKEAKCDAKQVIEAEKDKRSIIQELDQLFGMKSSRRLSRQLLTDMNVAQCQVILNFLLSRIEILNEQLVQFLITRDELAMEQDSLLTDIEDITKGIDSAE